MKKGDKVIIDDSSYSRSVVSGKLIDETLDNRFGGRSKHYVVVETGCSFPNTSSTGYMPTFNNTVIQAIDSGKVVFIEERFLRPVPPTHKIMVDVRQDDGWMYGQVVEISDKLYKEIKRDSQS